MGVTNTDNINVIDGYYKEIWKWKEKEEKKMNIQHTDKAELNIYHWISNFLSQHCHHSVANVCDPALI